MKGTGAMSSDPGVDPEDHQARIQRVSGEDSTPLDVEERRRANLLFVMTIVLSGVVSIIVGLIFLPPTGWPWWRQWTSLVVAAGGFYFLTGYTFSAYSDRQVSLPAYIRRKLRFGSEVELSWIESPVMLILAGTTATVLWFRGDRVSAIIVGCVVAAITCVAQIFIAAGVSLNVFARQLAAISAGTATGLAAVAVLTTPQPIEGFWSVPAGAKIEHRLAVEVRPWSEAGHYRGVNRIPDSGGHIRALSLWRPTQELGQLSSEGKCEIPDGTVDWKFEGNGLKYTGKISIIPPAGCSRLRYQKADLELSRDKNSGTLCLYDEQRGPHRDDRVTVRRRFP